jgi:hypothetical protein
MHPTLLLATVLSAPILQTPLVDSPRSLDCGYRAPPVWIDAVRKSVARGEIADPSKRQLPALPTARATGPGSSDDIAGTVDPTPCLGPNHVFSFEDTNGLLLTDFSDGELIALMTQAMNAVLATWGDRFDFIGFWTNFDTHHELGAAFYLAIRNDVSGIGDTSTLGTPIFDHHVVLGLAGQRIQGGLMFWNIDHTYWQPGTGSNADFTRLALAHETEHRFAVFLPQLLDGRVLQGDDATCGRTFHWNWRADGQGSAMEISEWVGSNPASLVGSFVTFNTDTSGVYSYTDLYLMGFVSPAEMDAGNSELRFMDTSTCAPTYGGAISSWSSTDIVASAGTRSPDWTTSQRNYRTAWVVIHLPGSPPTTAQKAKIVSILEQQQVDFNFGTLGRGTMNDTLFDDCNCNGIPDRTDIADGTSLDGNGNRIPDTCEPEVGNSICFGDGSGGLCPCANFGMGGHGCPNSEHNEGALLAANGTTSPDTVALDATFLRTSSLTVFFKGTSTPASPFVYGDGLRCVTGTMRRFGAQGSVHSTATFPGSFGGTLSAAGGNTPGSGQVAYYQVFYRDGVAGYCPPGLVNSSNAIRIVW